MEVWRCPKCGWEYRPPLPGTNGVAHECRKTMKREPAKKERRK